MTENWDDYAESWDRDAQPRYFSEQAFASLTSHVNLSAERSENTRILDFGCGTGLLTEKLAPLAKETIAVDTSPKMLEALRAKAIPNVTVVCADLDDPAVREEAAWLADLDLIVASSVCGFLPDYEGTVRNLCRALREGGHFVQWDWLASAVDDEYGLPPERISNALEIAGLQDVCVEEAFAISKDGANLPVLMGAGRLIPASPGAL